MSKNKLRACPACIERYEMQPYQTKDYNFVKRAVILLPCFTERVATPLKCTLSDCEEKVYFTKKTKI